MNKNNNAYWVGKQILMSGMSMGEPVKDETIKQPVLFQLDPQREALGLAVSALKACQDRRSWRSRYFNHLDQLESIEAAFANIIKDLEKKESEHEPS